MTEAITASRDASGLRVPAVRDDDDGEKSRGPGEPSGASAFRLAWVFVEGWRHRLRKAGDAVERSRWEWELDGTAAECSRGRASSLTFGAAVVADARRRVADEPREREKGEEKRKKRKSVHWE
ncbi:hypothetical protein ColKHC_03437 [Colletotrichum higginsianum]|nr:hypothetical protein ColKHC_03437 [Colletotrichum higginsianum]